MATYLLRSPDEEFARWKARAHAEQTSLAAWIRKSLDEAAGVGVYEPPDKVTPKQNPPAECYRLAFHRKGQFCKSCGATPTE